MLKNTGLHVKTFTFLKKKRFMKEVGINSAQIISLEPKSREDIIEVNQFRNEKKVSLLVVIYTIAIKNLFIFINQRELKNLKDIWMEHNSDNMVYFIDVQIDWSNNDIY